ncbi:hypothetical protein Lal_00040746 [Lupinus albus]|nr:hypothetical protein Lal_00040746 [Lupinus albus]
MASPTINDFIRDTYHISNENAEEGWIWEGHATSAFSANSVYWWLNYYDEVIDLVYELWVMDNYKRRNGLLFMSGQSVLLEDNTSMVQWRRPVRGQVKLNIDGSCTRGTNIMGGGSATRNHEGRWLSGFSATFEVYSHIIAEALAMEHGLNLAWNLGFKEIVF